MSVATLAKLAILVKQPVYKHFTKLRRNAFHRLASSASLATVATLTTKMGFWSIKTQTELNQSRNECVTNKMGFSRVAVAGVQSDILCGSKGLGGAESELPSRFAFGQSSKCKASRRQRLAQASRFGFGGRSPARQAKRDSPVRTTRKCSRDSQSESAERHEGRSQTEGCLGIRPPSRGVALFSGGPSSLCKRREAGYLRRLF